MTNTTMTFTDKVNEIARENELEGVAAIARHIGCSRSTLADALKSDADGGYGGSLVQTVDAALVRQRNGVSTIQERTVLVGIKISFWRARKFDKKVTDEVNRLHGATTEAGRYNKHLLGGRWPSYQRLDQAAGELRRIHYRHTMPWDESGMRLLATANFEAFGREVRAGVEEFEAARAAFAAEYPSIRKQAKELLNGMYNAADYPADVASKFQVEVNYAPVPSAGDFRLDLPADELIRIEESITRRVESQVEDAMRDVWDRLYDMVSTIRDRFVKSLEERGEDERAYNVRQGLLDQARELVDLLGRLNVTGDHRLDEMREAVLTDLVGDGNADALRDDVEARQATVSRADDIMARMRDVYGGPQEV